MWNITKIVSTLFILAFISVECNKLSLNKGLRGYFKAIQRGKVKNRIDAPKRTRRNAGMFPPEWSRYFNYEQQDAIPQNYLPSDEPEPQEPGFHEYPPFSIIPAHEYSEVDIETSDEGHKIFVKPLRVGHHIEVYPNDYGQNVLQDSQSIPFPDTLEAAPIDSLLSIESANESEPQEFENEPENEAPFQETSAGSDVQHVDFNREADILRESDSEGSGDSEIQARSIQIRIIQPLKSRIVNLFVDENTTTECMTPNNERGHCQHVTQCVMKDVINNFNVYFDYLCMIRSTFVGICCPDNPVIITNPEAPNSTAEREISMKQPTEGCGFSSRTRIVGGEISRPHEWTWMVALLRRNRIFCGGSLINSYYVLTAAHCTLGLNIKDITVRLGEHNVNNKTKLQQDIPIAEIKRHRGFTTFTFQHDIALLKLRRPAEFSRAVGTICLPQPENSYIDARATVVGWGTVTFGGKASPVLRQVTIPVWNNSDCDRTFTLEKIDESFLCAGMPNDEQDACQGDSGGPLMTVNEDGRWEVIGLVSWGRRCGDPDFPGVYTRVTTYLSWIQENNH